MANLQTYVTIKEFKAYQKFCAKQLRDAIKNLKDSLKKPVSKKTTSKKKTEVIN